MFKKAIMFVFKLISKIKEDNIIGLSAQFSYYIILGIFPFLILSISLLCNYSYYIYYLLDSVKSILPTEVFDIIYNVVSNSINNSENPFYSASILVILWSSTAGSATIITGINRAYGFQVKRNYFFMRLEGIVFSAAIMISMYLIFGLIVWGKHIITFMQRIKLFSEATYVLIDIFRYTLPIILLFLIFSAAYKFLTFEKVNLLSVLPGATFSTIGFLVGSMIYSNYVSTKTVYYDSIYGNLSSIIILLIWIFILSIIFLTGAEVNFLMSKNLKAKK